MSRSALIGQLFSKHLTQPNLHCCIVEVGDPGAQCGASISCREGSGCCNRLAHLKAKHPSIYNTLPQPRPTAKHRGRMAGGPPQGPLVPGLVVETASQAASQFPRPAGNVGPQSTDDDQAAFVVGGNEPEMKRARTDPSAIKAAAAELLKAQNQIIDLWGRQLYAFETVTDPF